MHTVSRVTRKGYAGADHSIPLADGTTTAPQQDQDQTT